MEITIAQELATTTAQLIAACAAMQARYGRHYSVKAGDPYEAWELHNAIFNHQAALAQCLDPRIVEESFSSIKGWWERHELLDLSTARDLMHEVSQLIAACAYFAADNDDAEWSYAMYCSQHAIARMLHPATRQVALAAHESQAQCHVG